MKVSWKFPHVERNLIYKQDCNLQLYVDFHQFIHASVIMGIVFSTRISSSVLASKNHLNSWNTEIFNAHKTIWLNDATNHPQNKNCSKA